jgi:tRNA pseudouridine55 synthase
MNGIVIVDKPQGKTSHDVVRDVKKALGAKKAGHTGTLDPLATGVLPICINEATKLAPFFTSDTKEYRVTMLLGVKTDTQDIEGNVIASVELPQIGLGEIKEALNRFIGKTMQTPPRFSAIKFRGKPLYKWARKGIPVEAHPRMIEVFAMDFLEVKLPHVTFNVSCSKGTYIRSLCSDIGDILGCGACLAGLRRMRSGRFVEDIAVSLKNINANDIISMVDALPDFPLVSVDQAVASKLRTGYQPSVEIVGTCHIPFINTGDVVVLVDDSRRLVAIARMLCSSDQLASLDGKEQAMKILRVFHCDS